MTRRLNWFLLVLALLVGLPFYWLLIDNRPGDAPVKPVSIAQLRQLASSIPGTAPSDVEMELVGWRRLPGDLFVAGSGIKRKLVGVVAWRLPVEGGKPVVIDSGLTRADAKAMEMEVYLPHVQDRIARALGEAGLVLVTHEHPDHEGALVAQGGPPLLQAARLNAGQVPPALLAAELAWPAGPAPAARIAGTGPQAVAPGVVVIPAPSHTPGSQMIYVRLANGREFLFAGDIATFAQSWLETRARSRLVGDHLAREDRREVFSWLRTITALKRQAPGLVVLPGHDPEWVTGPDQRAPVRSGFSLGPVDPAQR
ncbi:MAG: hypothetical protein RL702_1202 [Pseudomonadota bacterium]|jgi:glyoxylase-like metal-dependent hydrolase (beta-lactamase superfamily II)|nr:MBL fold metallo-hydrolase [Novosphingobium sp.]